MNSLYKTYCFSAMLLNKSTSYMYGQEMMDYKKTKRIYGDNKGLIGSVYDLTYEPTKINKRIYLGNAYNARDYYNLEENNIGMVINCSRTIPNYFEDDFEYERVDVNDTPGQDILKYIDEIVVKMNKFLKKNPKKNILVHCFMGSSRSATIVIAYIMKYIGYRRRDALNFVKSKRDLVNINIDFFNQLSEFEKTL